jgi:hypothetical protein
MAQITNPYFNVLGSKGEQRLLEDLVIECIKINGMKVYYIPRTMVKEDPIFGEDNLSRFEKVFPIEMYFDSPQGFEGDRDLLTKFGLELRDKANFVCSRRRFNAAVRYDGYNAIPSTTFTDQEVRPLEGDLIYLPLTNDLFEIRFAEHESVFYQVGNRYIWRITVEKFAYASEDIKTGVPEIDRIQTRFENLDGILNDPLADNTNIKTDATQIVDWSEKNPFGEPDHN